MRGIRKELMSKVKKEKKVQGLKKLAPITQEPEQEVLVQGFANVELVDAVKRVTKNKHLFMKDAIVWGLQSFLLNHGEEEAMKLGIVPEGEEAA
jgi:hypothetical protein